MVTKGIVKKFLIHVTRITISLSGDNWRVPGCDKKGLHEQSTSIFVIWTKNHVQSSQRKEQGSFFKFKNDNRVKYDTWKINIVFWSLPHQKSSRVTFWNYTNMIIDQIFSWMNEDILFNFVFRRGTTPPPTLDKSQVFFRGIVRDRFLCNPEKSTAEVLSSLKVGVCFFPFLQVNTDTINISLHLVHRTTNDDNEWKVEKWFLN